ncbi:MAG TPA: 1-acyl-sn-glycerol-3-phosphate acyltransferase [Cyclobacteriaceae bacterium]|nr:1-acyl-sn-glycerol-3-phosphate acyltransferase [Cyclobacteriaceae bacterium]
MESIFLFCYDYFKKRKKVFYVIFLLLFILVGFGATRIRVEEDISKFFPTDKKLEKATQVFQGSKFAEKLVMIVSLQDSIHEPQPDSLIAFTDSLVMRMQTELSLYIKSINFRVDDEVALKMYDLILQYLPVFLNEKDFDEINSITRPESIRTAMANNYRQLVSPTGMAMKKIIAKDPVGISRIVLKKLQGLQYSEDFELYNNYYFTKDHRYLLFFISPVFPPNDTGNNSKFLEKLDNLIERTQKQEQGISASYFGAAAIAAGNANQLRNDTVLTVTLMMALMFVFLFGFLRKKRAPFFILIPVLFGGLFSLAVINLIQGSISVLAIAAGSIVVGIAINYSLHFLSHLKEIADVRQTVKDLVHPMTLGSITTVLAFLSLQFANASMLRDIGLFAGLSLIGAGLCTLLFLPQLITDKFFGDHDAQQGWKVKLFFLQPKYVKYFIPFIFILTPLMWYYATDVRFNSDMTKLNFMSPELKQTESKLNKISKFSTQSVYVVADGVSLQTALKNNESMMDNMERMKQLAIVKKYSTVSSFLISDSLQQKRIDRWNAYWTDKKKESVIDVLRSESVKLKFTLTACNNFDSLLNRRYDLLSDEAFGLIKRNFFDDYITEKNGLTTVVTLASVDHHQISSFYKSFEKEKHVEPFDKRMLTNLFVSYVHADFTFIVTFTSILVFLVLLISYGRIELTMITFIPMLITWIWILGAMALLGIEFNIVNVVISTFIFGLGDDYSIFVMDGLQKEYKTGKQSLSSIQDSIFLSAVTTISGLGVLIFAQHPALKSIAAISIIGIVAVFLMSQIIEPYLFHKMISGRATRKLQPITLVLLLLSGLIYSIFIFGALLLTVIGFILFKVIPISNSKIRYAYHAIIQFFMVVMIFTGVPISKRIINRKGQYRKPMVIISNHQSFIDILLTAMLHPKVLLLTNNWVWNSPIFGWVVKMADYYPVTAGVEESVDHLRDRVKEGYSIMVFPEGTRFADGNIKRFHKGAFYISEKLEIDILPLLIHGTGESIIKGDIYIGYAELTMKFLSPIRFDDASYGSSYSERAKIIGRYFREEYQRFAEEVETPKHFRHKVICNFLYKGPVLEWYLRIKLRLENYYQPFHTLIPKEASVLDLGCGYGFLCYVLHFLSPNREVTGVDYDEEKIAIASNGYLRGEKLSFFCGDVTEYQFVKHDVIIISDVLHYLTEDQQIELLKKCFEGINPGGILILRDGDSDLKEKHKATKMTEFFSTKLLGFNKNKQPLQFMSGRTIKQLAEACGMEIETVTQQKFTSNVIFAIRKKS